MDQPPVSTRRWRILFADDDPLVRGAFARTLRARGYVVDLAADGDEALALATEHPYALIATDEGMPGHSGLELVSLLREWQRDATFLLVTGLPEVPRRKALALGVTAVIEKPWDDAVLLELVDAAVERASRALQSRLAAVRPSVREQVIVIEDSDLDAKLLQTMLRNAGGSFQVRRVRTLAEARGALTEGPCSVILSDLGLPDSSGLGVLAELQSVAPGTAVVVVTSADDEDQALRAMQAGAQDYLLKGRFDGDGVVRAIRYAVERKSIEKRLVELAHHDQLTGLANRALLLDRLDRALARATRQGRRAALLLVDLDHFKQVNDTHGHEVGDRLLVEVGARLSNSTRTEDTVARLGGDEFAVLLEELVEPATARRVAQRILNAFATPLVIDGKTLPVTPSIGVAIYPNDASVAAALMRCADTALYAVKAAGRNSVGFYGCPPGLSAVDEENDRKILAALDSGQLSLVFQPQVELQTGSVVAHEVLLRWNTPGQGEASARDFLPVLEETGDIVRVGRWVLDEACAMTTRWKGQLGRISINVSGRELADPAFVRNVRAALERHGLSGNALELEVRESVLSSGEAHVRGCLAELGKLGVGIAIDDYGEGSSCLALLSTLPVTAVKLHGALTESVSEPRRRALLSALTAAAKALGWTVVAKGVESDELLTSLRQLGCDRAQGTALASPEPAPARRLRASDPSQDRIARSPHARA